MHISHLPLPSFGTGLMLESWWMMMIKAQIFFQRISQNQPLLATYILVLQRNHVPSPTSKKHRRTILHSITSTLISQSCLMSCFNKMTALCNLVTCECLFLMKILWVICIISSDCYPDNIVVERVPIYQSDLWIFGWLAGLHWLSLVQSHVQWCWTIRLCYHQ